MYNKQRDFVFEQEKKGNAFIICPDKKLPVGRIEHNADVLRKTYEIGRKTALKQLNEIIEFKKTAE